MDEVTSTNSKRSSGRKLKTDGKRSGRRRGVKPSEIIIIVLFVGIVVFLVITLINKLTLTRDMSHARTVSNEVINDIQNRDGQAAYSLGSPTFKRSYPASELTQYFKSIKIATLKSPKLVDSYEVNGANGHVGVFIYEYTALKVPYYIRTEIRDNNGAWQLIAISGNADESQLLQ